MKKTIIRLTENDLHRLIEKTVKDMLSEEVDMGQVSSVQDKRDRRREESKDIQDIRKEIHRIRRKIGEYEKLGKDTSALTDRIKTLKKQANMCESSTLNEEGEGGVNMGCGTSLGDSGGLGGTSAESVLGNGRYEVPLMKKGKDEAYTRKKNGSIAVNTENTDVLSRPIYKL